MNKRIISLILAITLTLTALIVLTSCKDDTPDGDTCTVVFNSNGGTKIPRQSVVKGGKVTRPTDPIQENNTFLGWYLGDTLYDFDTPVTENIMLDAKWEVEWPLIDLPPQ